MRSDSPSPETPNPFAPPTTAQTTAVIEQVTVARVGFPPGLADCEYFTMDEFAALFEEKLRQACRTLAIPVTEETTQSQSDAAASDVTTATVRVHVRQLRSYKISNWNWCKQMVLPMLGYRYRAASFEIMGYIELPDSGQIPIHIERKFDRGRLATGMPGSDKKNMLVGMDSEAMRIISLLVRKSGQSLDEVSDLGLRFWWWALVVPLVCGVLLASLAYFTKVSFETRVIRAVLAFVTASCLSLACLPAKVYCDQRLAFAYQFTAAKDAATLRGFPVVVGVLSSFLLIASLFYGDG